MKYAVYDCGKPARFPEVDVHPSWNNNEFNTFEEALAYARHWLGPYGEEIILNLNEPWDYCCGSTIEIREI